MHGVLHNVCDDNDRRGSKWPGVTMWFDTSSFCSFWLQRSGIFIFTTYPTPTILYDTSCLFVLFGCKDRGFSSFIKMPKSITFAPSGQCSDISSTSMQRLSPHVIVAAYCAPPQACRHRNRLLPTNLNLPCKHNPTTHFRRDFLQRGQFSGRARDILEYPMIS